MLEMILINRAFRCLFISNSLLEKIQLIAMVRKIPHKINDFLGLSWFLVIGFGYLLNKAFKSKLKVLFILFIRCTDSCDCQSNRLKKTEFHWFSHFIEIEHVDKSTNSVEKTLCILKALGFHGKNKLALLNFLKCCFKNVRYCHYFWGDSCIQKSSHISQRTVF